MDATSKAILFALFLYFLTVDARSHTHESHDESLSSDVQEEPSDSGRMARAHNERSHRRKRYQHYNGYYPTRRYTTPFQQDQYQESLFEAFEQQQSQREILRKLDEILIYLRQPLPPPPPRVIYVRYPVPVKCSCNKKPDVPSGGVPPRFPSMEDSNQNWGATDDDDYQDQEFNRPLEFNEVEGSTALPIYPNNNPVTQAAPREPDASEGNCFAAVLRCCNLPDRKQQFTCIASRGCQKLPNKTTCSKQSLDAAINYFSKTYGKVQS